MILNTQSTCTPRLMKNEMSTSFSMNLSKRLAIDRVLIYVIVANSLEIPIKYTCSLEANAHFFFSSRLLRSVVSFWFIYVSLGFNCVLAVFFFIHISCLVVVGMVFVLRGECSCSVRDCGVHTQFGFGASRRWLCEPLASSYSTLKLWNCCYNTHMGRPMKIYLAQLSSLSARSLSSFYARLHC